MTLRVNQSLANTSTSVNYRSARPPRLIQIVAPFSSRLSRNNGAEGPAGARMIGPTISASGTTQILVATKPVDFRKQADSLAALVQEALGADPFSGTVYVFRAKRVDRVKLLWWDGTGLCLLSKRLEGGQFRWPRIEDGVMRLSAAQLSALVEGLDWVRVAPREVERPRAAQ